MTQNSSKKQYDLEERTAGFAERCRSFVKNLPKTHNDVQKVKIRKRKQNRSDKFANTFNGAFKDQTSNLRERAIFANNGETGNLEVLETFYVFPIDGYKHLYSKQVKNSTTCYNAVFESLLDQLGNKQPSAELLTELLRFNYVSENLTEGIDAGAEIIIYGIPYYYALRESSVDKYEKLLTLLN